MSIKYNERGEVVSVNGLTTGQHIGAPMQDAIADKPEDNQVYATERNTVTRVYNTVDDKQPKVGGSADWSVNDPEAAGYVKNRTHWEDEDGTVHKLDKKFLPDEDNSGEVGVEPTDILYVGAFFGADIKYVDEVPYIISEDGVALCLANNVPQSFANYYEPNVRVAVFPKAQSTGSDVGARNLEKAILPCATTIGSYAFRSCIKLPSVTLPVATNIGGYAFSNCQTLKKVDLGKATKIGMDAFKDCFELTAVILRSETMCTLSNKTAFAGCYHMFGTKEATHNPNGDKDCYIYVPSALINSYKTATYWNSFATQFRALEDYTVDGTIIGELDETKI